MNVFELFLFVFLIAGAIAFSGLKISKKPYHARVKKERYIPSPIGNLKERVHYDFITGDNVTGLVNTDE